MGPSVDFWAVAGNLGPETGAIKREWVKAPLCFQAEGILGWSVCPGGVTLLTGKERRRTAPRRTHADPGEKEREKRPAAGEGG